MSLFAGSTRSKFESAAYTVLFLAFFFAVGLAGGVLYRVLPSHKAPESAASSAPAGAPMAEAPAPRPVATASVAPTKPPAPAPLAAEAAPALAAAPAPSASAPAPAAPLPPPLAAAPSVAAPGEAAPIAKAATPPEHAAKEAAPAKTAKAAPPAPKPVAPAAKPKPATIAAAQPPKSVSAKPPPAKGGDETSAETGPFRIQFGAFAVEENAQRTLWDVEATGMPVEVVHAPNRKGHMLYYVRSQSFPDRDAALKAAVAAREKAKKFSHPAAIDYVVVSDAMIATMQDAASKP